MSFLRYRYRGEFRQPLRSAFAAAVLSVLPLGATGIGAAFAAAPITLHRLVILIDSDNEKVMGHAVSYAINIARSYAARNETVAIEIVANGSGIRLFRDDETPLRIPLLALRQQVPSVTYSMCDASRRIAEQKEGHSIAVMSGAKLVPFGIGRVMELEEAGWSYIHG